MLQICNKKDIYKCKEFFQTIRMEKAWENRAKDASSQIIRNEMKVP